MSFARSARGTTCAAKKWRRSCQWLGSDREARHPLQLFHACRSSLTDARPGPENLIVWLFFCEFTCKNEVFDFDGCWKNSCATTVGQTLWGSFRGKKVFILTRDTSCRSQTRPLIGRNTYGTIGTDRRRLGATKSNRQGEQNSVPCKFGGQELLSETC